MSRVRTIAVVVMSLLVGGVVFEVGQGQADPWGQPAPPRGPLPPMPPGPAPKPPKPPKPPKIRVGSGGGISISLHNGKLHIDGLDQLVAAHLQNVQNILANHPNLPKPVRDRIIARMDRVKAIVDKNVKQLDVSDPDKLGDQIEKMGDDLEKALEGLDADLAQLGDKLGKDLAKDIQKGLKDMTKIGPAPDRDPDDADDADDNDNDNDDDNLPNASVDPSTDDMNTAVDQLKNFALKPAQKDQIARMTADANAKVASERQALELASQQLETALADVDVTPAIVEGYVDRITKHEAAIRKTRLLTWVRARNVLDPDQRRQLEAVHRTK